MTTMTTTPSKEALNDEKEEGSSKEEKDESSPYDNGGCVTTPTKRTVAVPNVGNIDDEGAFKKNTTLVNNREEQESSSVSAAAAEARTTSKIGIYKGDNTPVEAAAVNLLLYQGDSADTGHRLHPRAHGIGMQHHQNHHHDRLGDNGYISMQVSPSLTPYYSTVDTDPNQFEDAEEEEDQFEDAEEEEDLRREETETFPKEQVHDDDDVNNEADDGPLIDIFTAAAVGTSLKHDNLVFPVLSSSSALPEDRAMPSTSQGMDCDSNDGKETSSSALPEDRAMPSSSQGMDCDSNDGKEMITPRAHDVCNGRGSFTNGHPGNGYFRRLVQSKRHLYQEVPKITKRLVAKAIVAAVHGRNPSGRFLERTEEGVWRVISYERAVDKASRALREKERDKSSIKKAGALSAPATNLALQFTKWKRRSELKQNSLTLKPPKVHTQHQLLSPSSTPTTLTTRDTDQTSSLSSSVGQQQVKKVLPSSKPPALSPPLPHSITDESTTTIAVCNDIDGTIRKIEGDEVNVMQRGEITTNINNNAGAGNTVGGAAAAVVPSEISNPSGMLMNNNHRQLQVVTNAPPQLQGTMGCLGAAATGTMGEFPGMIPPQFNQAQLGANGQADYLRQQQQGQQQQKQQQGQQQFLQQQMQPNSMAGAVNQQGMAIIQKMVSIGALNPIQLAMVQQTLAAQEQQSNPTMGMAMDPMTGSGTIADMGGMEYEFAAVAANQPMASLVGFQQQQAAHNPMVSSPLIAEYLAQHQQQHEASLEQLGLVPTASGIVANANTTPSAAPGSEQQQQQQTDSQGGTEGVPSPGGEVTTVRHKQQQNGTGGQNNIILRRPEERNVPEPLQVDVLCGGSGLGDIRRIQTTKTKTLQQRKKREHDALQAWVGEEWKGMDHAKKTLQQRKEREYMKIEKNRLKRMELNQKKYRRELAQKKH